MSEHRPCYQSVPVVDHRQGDVLPYYVRLHRLRRDGTENLDLFDTFDAALRWLEAELENNEDHHEDIQTMTLECISGVHVREKEGEDDGS